MLLCDSAPLSFVTKALTENPLSGAAFPWDSVSAAFATNVRCVYVVYFSNFLAKFY